MKLVAIYMKRDGRCAKKEEEGSHVIALQSLVRGHTREEHHSLLETKRFEVTQLMLEIEAELGIVFDKEDVTRERPIVVLEQ